MNASPDNGTKGIGARMPMPDGGIEAKAAGQRAAKSGSARVRSHTPLVFEKLCIRRHAPWLYREMMNPEQSVPDSSQCATSMKWILKRLLSQCRQPPGVLCGACPIRANRWGLYNTYDTAPMMGTAASALHICARLYRSTGAECVGGRSFHRSAVSLVFAAQGVFRRMYGFNTASLRGNMARASSKNPLLRHSVPVGTTKESIGIWCCARCRAKRIRAARSL